MQTFTKRKLSGSTDGKQITVTTDAWSTASANLRLHQGITGTNETEWDEIWMYACNISTAPIELEMQWGATGGQTGSADMKVTIPNSAGYILVAPGLTLQNSLYVRGRCATSNSLYIIGFVNRITN